MKKKEEGSALLWAVTLIMVLVVVIGAALQISYAYMSRSIEQNNERQAYLTAKGIIEDIVTKIEENDSTYVSLFNQLDELEETILSIEIPPTLGSITSNSYIERTANEDTKGKITIQIEAQFDEATYRVKADMQKGNKNGIETWQLIRYYQVDEKTTGPNNIIIGNALTNEMKTLASCWLTPSGDVDQCLTSKVSEEELANVKANVPNYRMMKNNDTLRNYFYYRAVPSGFPVFNKAEITNSTLGAKLLDQEYYIQPFFTRDDYKTMIVYANIKTITVNGRWADITMFYNDGHWYYVDDVKISDVVNGNTDFKKRKIIMTDFNSETTQGNTSVEKWARFKEKYLIPENIIQ